MMKRILLIASRPLAHDGLTKIEMDVIRAFRNLILFEVACGWGFENTYGEELKSYNVSCHKLPDKKRTFSYMLAINKLVKKKKYDAVYIHGNSAMMFLEAIPSKIAGTEVITHCHNTGSEYPLVHYLMKPVFNIFVDKKIGCSSLASRWAYCGRGIITIPNGIDIEKFKYDETIRESIRTDLGWSDKKIVGHIGRFSRQKNHSKLIGIFDEMHKMDDAVRLLLIGDGELNDIIKREISDRKLDDFVFILKYTDVTQNYMQAMDLMIVPSLFEGLCLVAVEAQANGIPVLIDTFFSPETSVTEQAKSIDLALSDAEWAKEGLDMMKKGRQNVTQQLRNKRMDQSNMMESILRVLIS